LAQADWHCGACGSVEPLHVPSQISLGVLALARDKVRSSPEQVAALWCPWPLLSNWTVTGVAWAGRDRTGVRAAAVALTGPDPLADGPADAVFVAEELGVGLGNGLAGLPGLDPGAAIQRAVASSGANAKVRVSGHLTPLWSVASSEDRSVYVGEARGMWLYAITWPATAGYVLVENIVLHDLAESIPSELVLGAPSQRLRLSPPDS
jgi:hypothetical protein